MGFGNSVSSALRGFARAILDIDDTQVPKEQLAALRDLLAKQPYNQAPSDLRELMDFLKQKHIVDSISISQTNGALLASSTGNGASEVITASAMFNYVQSEIPKSEVVLIKSKDTWNMLFKYLGKIFVVKAPTHLTTIELRVISNEVEAFLVNRKKKLKHKVTGKILE